VRRDIKIKLDHEWYCKQSGDDSRFDLDILLVNEKNPAIIFENLACMPRAPSLEVSLVYRLLQWFNRFHSGRFQYPVHPCDMG